MLIPFKYNFRSVMVRRASAFVTIASVALIVVIFIGVMALAYGIETAMVRSGDPLNVMARRRGADSEMSSSVSPEAMHILRSLPSIRSSPDGKPMAAAELVVVVNLPKRGEELGSNITIRGTSPEGFALRPQVRLVEGRLYRQGLNEAVVSRAVARRFDNVRIGDRLRLGKGEWEITGYFEAANTAFDSEIWVDVNQLASDYNRASYSSALLRADDEAGVAALIQAIETDRRFNLMAERETDYYKDQTRSAKPIRFFGLFIVVVMGIGGCFAAMNTMYAAVAYRSREIALLRTLGFKRRGILFSFLIESLLLALLGGLVGSFLVWPINGLTTGTTNWRTFSEVAFAFRVSPGMALEGLGFAALMGLLGGLLPASRASSRSSGAEMKEM